jgi:outer membrane protein assembly factor BamE (lipoprotein component of BamABCDE complex)
MSAATQGSRGAALVAVLLVTSGCVPIPTLPFGDKEWSRQNIGDSVPGFVVSGQTTRADVILALGDPDRRTKDDMRFFYVRATEEGGVAFLVGGGMRGGVVGTPVTYRLLTVDFDARGIVIGTKSEKVVKRDFFGEHITGTPPQTLFPDAE